MSLSCTRCGGCGTADGDACSACGGSGTTNVLTKAERLTFVRELRDVLVLQLSWCEASDAVGVAGADAARRALRSQDELIAALERSS